MPWTVWTIRSTVEHAHEKCKNRFFLLLKFCLVLVCYLKSHFIFSTRSPIDRKIIIFLVIICFFVIFKFFPLLLPIQRFALFIFFNSIFNNDFLNFYCSINIAAMTTLSKFCGNQENLLVYRRPKRRFNDTSDESNAFDQDSVGYKENIDENVDVMDLKIKTVTNCDEHGRMHGAMHNSNSCDSNSSIESDLEKLYWNTHGSVLWQR